MNRNCYCGRSQSYDDCCGAIHKGIKRAVTAEDLMRSRYSAFVCADVDYILATYSSETCPGDEREEILSWAQSVEWLGLDVVGKRKGSEEDTEAWVEFKASFIEDEKKQVIHENSCFRKENGVWVYVSGEYPQKAKKPVLPNRNDPCYCGSGQKFKKCCWNKQEKG